MTDVANSGPQVLYRYPPPFVAVGIVAAAAFGTAIGLSNGRSLMDSALVAFPIAAVLGWRTLRMRLLDDGVALVSRGFFRSGAMRWSEIREIVPEQGGGYAWAFGSSRKLQLACVPATTTQAWQALRLTLLHMAEARSNGPPTRH